MSDEYDKNIDELADNLEAIVDGLVDERFDENYHLYHEEQLELQGGRFGAFAESFARFFGTPVFLIAQTVIVIAWIAVNVAMAAFRWDPYPFILLNLAFSTQAAYAAPLILLAQSRQAVRDAIMADELARHREEAEEHTLVIINETHRLAKEIHKLTTEVHAEMRR